MHQQLEHFVFLMMKKAYYKEETMTTNLYGNHHRRLSVMVPLFVLGFLFLFTALSYAVLPKPEVREEYVEGASKAAADTIPVEQFNLPGAAYAGLINNIVYLYVGGDMYLAGNVLDGTNLNVDDQGYINDPLPVGKAFWLRAERNCSVVFPWFDSGPSSWTFPINDSWRFRSIPVLVPSGSDFPHDYAGFTMWRWKNNAGTGTGAMIGDMPMVPGRSYWMKGPGSITFSGSRTPLTKNFRYRVPGGYVILPEYLLKLQSNLTTDQKGDFMLGNPFTYGIALGDVWIENPMNPAYWLGKPVATGFEVYNDMLNINKWAMDFTLSDLSGTHYDTSNMAGVLETGKDLHSLFNAQDLVGPNPDYIRLAFRDPDNSSSLLTFDYRAPGLETYEWTMDLSTTINSIATKLSLDNFSSIPAGYSVTLTDTQTGTVYPLTGNASIDVTLTSDAPKTFILTATRQKPVSVAETGPVALNVKNIFPNPFNPATTISFDVNKAGKVTMNVYNVSGQLVETLVNANMLAGSHQVVWNAAKLSSGVYIVRITSNGFTATRKVTFMK